MDLYRVLLVDDEEDIRVGISRKMDWEGLGFTLVGEAENGQEALELADTLCPDVVLTDIKMPFLDGLELCRILTGRLRAIGPGTGQWNLFFLELLTCLLRLARGGRLDLTEAFGQGFTGTVQAGDFPTPEALGEWCLERCLRIQGLIRRQRTDSAGRTVERAKEFILEHYRESGLSVERLCAYLRGMMRVSDAAYYQVIKDADLQKEGISPELELLYQSNRDHIVSIAVFTEEGKLEAAAPVSRLKPGVTPRPRAGFSPPGSGSRTFTFPPPTSRTCLWTRTTATGGWSPSAARWS